MDSATAESIFHFPIANYQLLLTALWHKIHIRWLQLGVAQEFWFHFHADPIQRRGLGVNAH